jgi:AraC-like DNA-binding protein
MSSRLSGVSDWTAVAHEAHYCCETMASNCGVCIRQLERFFQQEFGSPPREWTCALRMNCARDLIAEGYSTKAAAIELFFCHSQHFCHEFTKYWGVSPQHFAPTLTRSK